MLDRICRNSHVILALACCLVLPRCVAAQKVTPPNVPGAASLPTAEGLILMVETIDLEGSVTGPGGGAIEEAAVETGIKSNGQFYRQRKPKKCNVRVEAVVATRNNVQ